MPPPGKKNAKVKVELASFAKERNFGLVLIQKLIRGGRKWKGGLLGQKKEKAGNRGESREPKGVTAQKLGNNKVRTPALNRGGGGDNRL